MAWTANPPGDAVTNYLVHIGDRSGIYNLFSSRVGDQTAFVYDPPQVIRRGVTLFITVSAENRAGEGPKAPEVTVRIECPERPLPQATLLSPPDRASFYLLAAPTISFAWTPIPGAAAYVLEYTGPNRQFRNPNGTGPDPVNGLGGAGGALGPIVGTSLDVRLSPVAVPGTYQWRVIGCDAACLVLIGRASDARSFTLVPPFVTPIDPSRVVPGLRVTGAMPFTLDSRNPATNQTVQEDLTPALTSLSQGAITTLRQDRDTGVVQATGAPGVALAFLPIGLAPAGGLSRQQAADLVVNDETGTAVILTPGGQRVEVMGAPPDLRGLLQALGAGQVEIRPGQYLATLPAPGASLSLRLSFSLIPATGPAAFQRNPDGTATVTYGTGQGQTTFPVFADVPAFLTAVREGACGGGLTEPRAAFDGLVTVAQDGRQLRARPTFEVGPSPSGTKRCLVEPDGGFAFDFGDGRRQRFTIMP